MTTEQVVEHVLYQGEFADEAGRHPLFSDADIDVVRQHKVDAIRDAFAAGKARPVLSMSKRTATYPLDSKGRRLAIGSTVTEEEI